MTVLLVGCTEQGKSEPLAGVQLNPQQIEALRRMNEAGTTAFEGHTWRYEFGAGCVLRVRRSFEARADKPKDHDMTGRSVEVVGYARTGFGVKAYRTAKGGSVDLIDTASNAEATAFAHFASNLIQPCTRS